MIQTRDSNTGPDWPGANPELARELWVSATMVWVLARLDSDVDIEKEVKDCVKEARGRLGKMLAEHRRRANRGRPRPGAD
jgi:hypothetical protein